MHREPIESFASMGVAVGVKVSVKATATRSLIHELPGALRGICTGVKEQLRTPMKLDQNNLQIALRQRSMG